jgi:hypothetical protein
MDQPFQQAPWATTGSSMVGATSEMVGIFTALTAGNQLTGRLISAIERQLAVQSPFLSYLSIAYSTAGGTTVAIGPGRSDGAIAYLCSIHVTTPTTAASSTSQGLVYDCASPASVGSSNLMTFIPSSGIQIYNVPFVNGLTIQPSSISTQTVSVYYINQIPTGV